MNTTITDYIDVRSKLIDNGWSLQDDFALIPSNLSSDSEYYYENSAKTVKTLFRNNNIEFSSIEDSKIGYRQLNAFEWIGPTLFIGFTVWSQNPNLISISCGIISNYLTDFFKGIAGKKSVKMEIVIEVEKNKKYKKISFEGPPESLKDLPEIIKSAK